MYMQAVGYHTHLFFSYLREKEINDESSLVPSPDRMDMFWRWQLLF